jgi:transglutaminase-like putative cysteine protease
MGVAAVPMSTRPLSLRASSTVALTALLVLATGWSVLDGGWAESSPSALLVGVAGMLEALLLARVRMPRLGALALAPVLLFVSLLPTTLGARPAAASGVSHVVAQYASAATTGLLGNAQWEFNVGLSAVLWVCGAWAAWFAVRERRGTVATGPCWSVLAVGVINAPVTGRADLPAAVAAAAAIMLIAAVHLDRLSAGWRRHQVAVLPGTDGRFAIAAAGGGVLVLLLALVLPPLTSTDISGRLFGVGGGGPNVHAVRGAHGGEGIVQFNPATVLGGRLSLSNQPVLTYRTNTTATPYLRMAADSVFFAGNWQPDTSDNNADVVGQTVRPGPLDRDRTISDGGVGDLRTRLTATILVSADSSGSNVVPFPGEPDTISEAATVTGTSPPGDFNGLLTIDSVSSTRSLVGVSLITTGTVSTATADQLRNAGTAYPSFIQREGFVLLPDDQTGGAAQIRQLAAQWTVNATNAYDRASAIENHLRNPQLFHYTLDPSLPTDGSWPLVYFLTRSHAGYCQYFASAMGAMLRSLGIPARLINGYGPGSAPEAAGHGNNVLTHTVTSNDAHTWVEAYFPGYGWVPFEPTPSSPQGDYQTFQRGGATAAPSTAPAATAQPSDTPAPRASSTPAIAEAPVAPDAPGGPTAPVALVVVTLGLIALVVLLITTTTWFLRPRGIRGVWRRVGLIGRVLGVRRDPTLTFAEYARRLAGAVPPDTTRIWHRDGGGRPGAMPLRRRVTAALAEIAAVSDIVTYGAGSAHPRETVRMRRAWRRIARVAPRLGWRAVLRRSVTP